MREESTCLEDKRVSTKKSKKGRSNLSVKGRRKHFELLPSDLQADDAEDDDADVDRLADNTQQAPGGHQSLSGEGDVAAGVPDGNDLEDVKDKDAGRRACGKPATSTSFEVEAVGGNDDVQAVAPVRKKALSVLVICIGGILLGSAASRYALLHSAEKRTTMFTASVEPSSAGAKDSVNATRTLLPAASPPFPAPAAQPRPPSPALPLLASPRPPQSPCPSPALPPLASPRPPPSPPCVRQRACTLANVLPPLPVLSDANRATERAWHSYVHTVYGSPLPAGQVIDLNTFTWFFTDDNTSTARAGAVEDADGNAPTQLLRSPHHCLSVCEAKYGESTYEGSPWVHAQERTKVNPGYVFLAIGFFVQRSVWSEPSAFEQCSRVEVSHVRSSFSYGGAGERGVSWFFHTVGSGIFLDCTQLPTRGRTVVYRDRLEFSSVNQRWEDDRVFPYSWMEANGVAMIIFTQEGFKIQGNDAPPRTEILVRLENRRAVELDGGDRGVCLEGPGLRVKLFAGWHGASRCACSPLHKGGYVFLHCEHNETELSTEVRAAADLRLSSYDADTPGPSEAVRAI